MHFQEYRNHESYEVLIMNHLVLNYLLEIEFKLAFFFEESFQVSLCFIVELKKNI